MKEKVQEHDTYPPNLDDDWHFDYDEYKANNYDDEEELYDESYEESEEKDSIVRLPINSSKENMKNKQCNYKTLSILTLYSASNYNENTRYSYKNSLIKHKDEIENLSKIKLDTIFKHIKKICKLDNELVTPVVGKDSIAYIIKYTGGENGSREYVVIEKDIIKFLIKNCSSEEIKTYIFLKYRCAFKKGEAMVTNNSICENIGLSKKSHGNISKVTKMINNLVEFNLIKKKTTTQIKICEGKEKCTYRNIYSMVSYEEFSGCEH